MILCFTKIEYIVLTKATQEILWFKRVLKKFKLLKKLNTIFLFNNNMGATLLAKNLEYKPKIKYIKIKKHWIKKTY